MTNEKLNLLKVMIRLKVMQAEQERIDGAETMSVASARKQLKERINEK